MAQYISIDVLQSAIEKLKKEEYYDIHDEYDGFVRNAFDKLFSSVSSMAVKIE